MRNIKIESFQIGTTHPPFLIAEMSGNHGNSLDKALRLVDAAAEAGAHALKLQTYTADTMTLDLQHDDFTIDDPDSLWFGNSLYDLYRKAYTPWEWHEALFARARACGMVAFSTPFDASSLEFLESLRVPCYKIASFENGDLPLIRMAAKTGKPLIISTGTATLAELDETVDAARSAGCLDLILLKCTSSYPADPASANLRTLPFLQKRYDCHVGLSDHTLGTAVSLASIALGACVIEKHFTLNRSDGDIDGAFSLEPDELKRLVIEAGQAWEALGKESFELSESDSRARRHRRSLYVAEDILAGEAFTSQHVRAIRPGNGLPPKHLTQVLASLAATDIKRGTPLRLEMLKPKEGASAS